MKAVGVKKHFKLNFSNSSVGNPIAQVEILRGRFSLNLTIQGILIDKKAFFQMAGRHRAVHGKSCGMMDWKDTLREVADII